MITSNSDIPYLGIAFADLLDIDIIQNLKEGFGMMGMRFAGKPNKAQMVKAYDEYVKGNPADVLRCLRSENLELMNGILKQGKGGHVTVKGTQIYNQLQKMNLVVSRENTRARTTDLYLIDELYDLFASHIDEVMRNPVDYNTEKSLKTPLDAVIFEISYKCRELVAHIDDWTKKKSPKEMSRKERDGFGKVLDECDDVLEDYTDKLTTLIAATPNGFGCKEGDIVRIKKTIKSVHDVIDHMQILLEAIDSGHALDDDEEDDSDDIDPEEKAQLEQVLQSKEFKDAMKRIEKDRMDAMDEAERASREDGPVKFLPAFTKHPAKYPARKESYCATRLVRPRVFEVTIPLEDGVYFIVYFNFLEQNGYTQATCYWGGIFDFAQKAAAEPYPGAGYVMLSKPFRKKYPHVASVYGMHEDRSISDRLLPTGRKNQECTKPYLTTIGWEGQPKEWFLSMRLYDFDYVRLITYSPLDCPEVIEAIDELKKASLAMMRDIQQSDAKSPKQLMNELFGL
jgi:hypothetical protein